MREINLQTAVHEIVDSALRRREKGEDFPFFFIVGAGISHPPIPLAAGIEKLCRERLSTSQIDVPRFDESSALDRYQTLFEHAYYHAQDRQDFLHELIHRKPISAANFRLAHLLGELKLTNLVFTTNFDEMLSRALRLFGYDVVVCDHPKTTTRIRPVQKDLAQVVHVHGTHWFYDCCNLRGEIESQAQLDLQDSRSIGQLLDRVLADRSPIVIGYSGWEGDVVMSALRRRLAQPTLPRDIYWFCYRHPDAENLPSWLKMHNSIRLILPPPPLKEKKPVTPKDGRRGEKAGELRADESFEREPVLSAREILEALIQKLKLEAPLLTKDPLKFFSDQLVTSLLLEEEDGEDLYLLQQVIDRVRRSAQREEEDRFHETDRERANTEALSRLSDAVRRLAHKEALEIAQHVDRSALTAEQHASLNAALEQTAKALVNEGIALRNAGQPGEAISIYEEVVKHFGDSPELALRGHVAEALVNKGLSLWDLERFNEELVAYEEVVERFGNGTQPALREQIAQALFYKGVTLGQLGRSDEEVAVYEEVVARFADATEPALREQVAKALFNKGWALGQLGRSDEEVAVYEEVVARFADATEPALREQVAKALFNKGFRLGQLGRSDEAVAVYEEVVARFADATEPALREQVAKALLIKGVALEELGRSDEAVTVYEEVVARFADATEPALRDQVAQALDNLSHVLLTNQRWSEALETARRAVSFGAERYKLACALSRTGNSDEALSELEGCLSRGEISREHVRKDPDWEALREDPRFQELTKEPEGA